MKRLTNLLLVIFGALVLSGCATGPKYETVRDSLPPLNADQGRIFFYRLSVFFGDGLQPEIKLNGEVIGTSQPGGFFFVDRAPGDYEVVIATETDKRLSFTLAANQVRYVKQSISMGVIVGRVVPSLVNEGTGMAELPGLSYTGQL